MAMLALLYVPDVLEAMRRALTGGRSSRRDLRLLCLAAYLTQALPLIVLGGILRLSGAVTGRDLPLWVLVLSALAVQALAVFLASRREAGQPVQRVRNAFLLLSGPVAAMALAAVSLAFEPTLLDALALGLTSLALLAFVFLLA